jgi:hypothetical protein
VRQGRLDPAHAAHSNDVFASADDVFSFSQLQVLTKSPGRYQNAPLRVLYRAPALTLSIFYAEPVHKERLFFEAGRLMVCLFHGDCRSAAPGFVVTGSTAAGHGWSVDGSLVKRARNILKAEAIERHGQRGAPICGATEVIPG